MCQILQPLQPTSSRRVQFSTATDLENQDKLSNSGKRTSAAQDPEAHTAHTRDLTMKNRKLLVVQSRVTLTTSNSVEKWSLVWEPCL